MTPVTSPVQLWRINLKPDSQQGVDAATFCIDRGIVGIGWALDPAPVTKDDYWNRGRATFGQGRSWSAAANVVLHRMRVGDLIWTRNRQGIYFLGKIADDWRHEVGPDFKAADIANVRSCTWAKVGAMDNVPGAVINAFRPASTVQLVSDPSATVYSQLLFGELTREAFAPTPGMVAADILQLLSAEDLEDVAAVYLQVTFRCIMFPSTCKISTMAVECVFTTLEGGQRIGLQVKSGGSPINQDDYASFDGMVYLFAASGNYLGSPHPNCVCLTPDMIRSFVMENSRLMPGRIQRWIRYVELTRRQA
jgi:hypothetical protein